MGVVYKADPGARFYSNQLEMATATVGPVPTLKVSTFRQSSRGRGNLHDESVTSTSTTLSTVQDDLTRILEPSMKKLTTVESQRILSVLDECIKKMHILSALPVILRDLHVRFAVSFGSEVVQVLEEHDRLQREYFEALREKGETLGSIEALTPATSQISIPESPGSASNLSIHKPRKLEPLLSKPVLIRTEEELQVLLKHSTRNVLRVITRDPAAMGVTMAIQPEPASHHSALFTELQSLKFVLLERLLTTHQEKENQKQRIDELSQKLQDTTATVNQLELELSEAERLRKEEKDKHDAQISKLRMNIHKVEKLAEDLDQKVKVDSVKQLEGNKKVHETKLNKLSSEFATEKKQYDSNVLTDREEELKLRKKVFKRETEVDNWITKYDSEMGEKQNELEEVESQFLTEKDQLKELTEKFAVLEIEYNHVQEEKRIAREKAEEAEKKMSQMMRAATIIQSCWRAYKCRKSLKGDSRKSGKKKGKGKGKGKKKK